jgi:hypothetical protein
MNIRTVREVLNREEVTFEKCWDILVQMAIGNPNDGFFEFQPTLGASLLRLEQLYQDIASERRRLIRRKGYLSPSWFRKRQRALAGHQQTIRHAMYIGRAIGDAFAWYFYQSSAALLGEHLAWPEVEFPTGEGGIGEVGFVQNVQSFEGQFILYHSITSILRIGDISLFDLNGRRITALGEVKSRRIGPRQFRANVSLIASATDGSITSWSSHRPPERQTSLEPLPEWIRHRLKRQVAAMAEALKAEKVPDIQRDQVRKGLAHRLSALASKARVDSPATGLIDPCVLVTVIKFRRATMYGRLTRAWGGERSLAAVPRYATRLAVKDSSWNSLHVGTLLYNGEGKPTLMRGALPPFWSGLPHDASKLLYFQGSMALVLFNPAPILHALEDRGWLVKQIGDQPLDVVATRKREGHECQIEGFPFFFNLVMSTLWSSDELLDMIDEFADQTWKQVQETGSTKYVLDLRMRASSRNVDAYES